MANYLLICLNKKDAGPAIMISMAKSLANNKNNFICCIASDRVFEKNKFEELEHEDNVDVVFLDSGDRKTIGIKTCKLLLFDLNKIVEKYRDITFDLSLQIMAHIWGKQINERLNVKHSAVICHDPTPHSGESFVNILFSNYSYKHCDSLIVLSESLGDEAEKRYKKQVYCIKHGLFSTYRTDKPKKENEHFTYLFFGRIEKYKGIDILLKAYDKLRKMQEFVHLIIAGSGDMSDYSDTLTSMGENLTVINKYISNEEIVELFNCKNTVIVLPYIDATQSGVIPIAIEYGLPVIASSFPGLIEQLDNGHAGIFVNPNDANDLFEKMKSIVENQSIYYEQSELMQKLRNELDWGHILDGLMDKMSNK